MGPVATLPRLTSDFDYELPRELIAQRPLPQRDESRMMVVVRRGGGIIHARFHDLPDYLHKGDLLVLNSAKVIPAKAWGKKEGQDIEFLFLKEKEEGAWEVLCRPAKKIKKGDRIVFASGFEGHVTNVEEAGKRVLRFSARDIPARLKKIGFAPLPPYIKRPKKDTNLRPIDLERYQTVFARQEGAIAAPTAGLHFTPQVLERIKKRGVIVCNVNLEVGQATFQPVRAERIGEHKMLEERFTINLLAARKINMGKKENRPVVAVGTTVVRALESASEQGRVRPGTRSTSLFICPGYTFKTVDRLLTNLHLPRSTLLMLVSAFAGHELIQKAYAEAMRQKYRFYSYGDCMLII
jgi:S-adenosylmethionine:tRNA ribosyltransferase-isomerase